MPKPVSKTQKKTLTHLDYEPETTAKQKLADLQLSDKIAKKVIAPFVRIVRKGQKLLEIEDTQFTYFAKRKPSVLIRDLSSFLSDSVDIASILHETSDVLKNVTKASGVNLYMMDSSTNEIYQSMKVPVGERHKIRWKIRDKSTVAAWVAYKKQHVLLDDLITDERFPEGIGYLSHNVKPVLCIPVVTPDEECFAVIELIKQIHEPSFTRCDLEIALIVTGWMGAAIHQNSKRLALQRQLELNDYFLDLTKCFFGESVIMEKMMSEIVKFLRVTLKAERSSVFIIDAESGEELLADLFEDSGEEVPPTGYKKPQKVRLSKERGIASYVARSGAIINIKDAYRDNRFNKDVDQKAGYITRSILCMPILSVDGILGIIQVVNKLTGGGFSPTDELLFRTFSTYSAITLRYSKVRTQLKATKHLNNCFLKMLKLQAIPCEHDVHLCKENLHIPLPMDFDQPSWYVEDENISRMPPMAVKMLLNMTQPGELNIDQTIEYVLAVRKFYRKIPYHNFEHAFTTCHSVYLLLKHNTHHFTPIEIKGLMLASLSHCLDHGGLTNSFLLKANDDLAHLYNSAYLQHHHFYLAMFLLDQNPIFNNISKEEYKELTEEIEEIIFATHNMVYFMSKARLQKIANKNKFNWNDREHRKLLKALIVNISIVSTCFKPFLVASRIADSHHTEVYRQGDLEKQMGYNVIHYLDREKDHLNPETYVQFMNIYLIPGLVLLKQILPHTVVYYNDAMLFLNTFKDVIANRGKKCWRQDDSIVKRIHTE